MDYKVIALNLYLCQRDYGASMIISTFLMQREVAQWQLAQPPARLQRDVLDQGCTFLKKKNSNLWTKPEILQTRKNSAVRKNEN